MRWQTTFRVSSVMAMSFLAICGCGGGEKTVELVAATGTVNYQGKPLAGATVQMILGTKVSTGFTDAQGKFKMTTGGRPGVPIGSLKVSITKFAAGAPAAASADTKKMTPEDMMNMQKAGGGTAEDLTPKSEIPEKYADPEKSNLVANIEKDASKNVFEYDLVD